MLDILPTELIRKISSNISDISDMYNARLSSKLFCDSISNVKLTKGRLQHKITNRHKFIKNFNDIKLCWDTPCERKCLNYNCDGCYNTSLNVACFRKARFGLPTEVIYNIPYCSDCLINLYPDELYYYGNRERCFTKID